MEYGWTLYLKLAAKVDNVVHVVLVLQAINIQECGDCEDLKSQNVSDDRQYMLISHCVQRNPEKLLNEPS